MPRRIYSLETEYALMINGSGSAAPLSQIYNLLEGRIHAGHSTAACNTTGRQTASPQLVEIKEGFFLESGARLYYDTGHLEWACPECDNPVDTVIWGQAADRNLEEALHAEQPQLSPSGHNGQIMLIKNNVDPKNDKISYGCHENYSISRYTPNGGDTFDFLKELLPAFLITRGILSGAGKFGVVSEGSSQPVPYQITQRSSYISHLVSRDTRENRAILNDRDEPLADQRKYRRLHIILGDSNLSSWSNLIKLGTTGLVLDALEQGTYREFPILLNPIETLHEVSSDLNLKKRYRMRAGEPMTAIEIQRFYWRVVRNFYERQVDEKNGQIIQMWDDALSALERDPKGLSDKADWAIKYRMLTNDVLPQLNTNWDEINAWHKIISLTWHLGKPPISETLPQYMRRNNLSAGASEIILSLLTSLQLNWQDYRRQWINHSKLRMCDALFHNIDRSSYFAKYWTGSTPRLPFDDGDIERARYNAPTGTRAQIRNLVIRSSAKNRLLLGMDWDKLIMRDGRIISLGDPFLSHHRQVEREFS